MYQATVPAVTSNQRRVLSADEQFTAGRLLRAETLCRELWKEEHRSPILTALLAEILLLRNRTAEAEPLLRKAITEQGGNPRLIDSLAECLRRSDRLAEAAQLFRGLGRTAFADKLRRLSEGGWYLLPEGAVANLPWAPHADLPMYRGARERCRRSLPARHRSRRDSYRSGAGSRGKYRFIGGGAHIFSLGSRWTGRARCNRLSGTGRADG